MNNPRHSVGVAGGDLALTDETTAYRWADDTNIRELTTEAYAIRVLDALRADQPPAIRQHDGVHLL